MPKNVDNTSIDLEKMEKMYKQWKESKKKNPAKVVHEARELIKSRKPKSQFPPRNLTNLHPIQETTEEGKTYINPSETSEGNPRVMSTFEEAKANMNYGDNDTRSMRMKSAGIHAWTPTMENRYRAFQAEQKKDKNHQLSLERVKLAWPEDFTTKKLSLKEQDADRRRNGKNTNLLNNGLAFWRKAEKHTTQDKIEEELKRRGFTYAEINMIRSHGSGERQPVYNDGKGESMEARFGGKRKKKTRRKRIKKLKKTRKKIKKRKKTRRKRKKKYKSTRKNT